jgi:hypothetical protein
MLISPLPRWLQKRYAILWEHLRDKPFDFDKAQKILNDKPQVLNVVLSQMRKNGWLEVSFNPNNTRKRIYKLIPLEVAYKKLAKSKRSEK